MNLLVAAVVILWVLVVVLGVAVFALARQVGVLYERVAPAGALTVNQQLKAGDPAPQGAVTTLDNKTIQAGHPATDHRQLLFFLAPDCPICKSLLPVLKSLGRVETHLEIVLLSDGLALDEHKQFVLDAELGQFDYAVSELAGRSYGVSKLPYGVLINTQGVISTP